MEYESSITKFLVSHKYELLCLQKTIIKVNYACESYMTHLKDDMKSEFVDRIF